MTPNNILGSNTQSASRRKDAPPTANGNKPIKNQPAVTNTVSASQKEREREEREKLVIWKYPLKTLEYSCREIYLLLYTNGLRLMQYRKTVLLVTLLLMAVGIYLSTTGGLVLLSSLVWGLYWTGLGLLSSVGFGTGLHTFLIYLGPHIAKVTLAAYECGALNFPEPPYPDEIICPDEPDMTYAASLWNIMTKVRVEAMLWGAGTALGELPPYFMARASRLSGYDPNDEDDLREFEELQKKIRENPDSMTIIDKMKSFVEKLVERVGFFGILACASIPNPLFDLAGITCGHFLVPFWTFFGATLIGKAIVKMHIQKLFVIIAFNETLIEKAVTLLAEVPVIGNKLQEPFKEFLNKQKTNLHRKPGSSVPSDQSRNLLSTIFEIFVIAMILYFLVSIVNSLAQSYHKRIHSHNRGSGKSKQASD